MDYIITPPEGFEKVETKYTNGNIHITFKETPQSIVPKNWEDFCIKNPSIVNDYFIDTFSQIQKVRNPSISRIQKNNSLYSSKKRAEAMGAFIRLIRVRDYVNGDWIPDWEDTTCYKYIIYNRRHVIITNTVTSVSASLVFKTSEIRDQFLTNFRDLIEEAKEFI